MKRKLIGWSDWVKQVNYQVKKREEEKEAIECCIESEHPKWIKDRIGATLEMTIYFHKCMVKRSKGY